MTNIILSVSIGITIFLCLLNVAFAFAFRKKSKKEVFSYIMVSAVEMVAFGVVIVLRLHLVHIPLHLPVRLPVTRTEIGAALAVGIGLFPAAYWHRTSAAQIRARMEQDAKIVKEQGGAVRVRNSHSTPGEWLN